MKPNCDAPSSKLQAPEKLPKSKFSRCLQSLSIGECPRPVPPHPNPLPQGEGAASSSLLRKVSGLIPCETGKRFSLSPRERAGVRGESACASQRAWTQSEIRSFKFLRSFELGAWCLFLTLTLIAAQGCRTKQTESQAARTETPASGNEAESRAAFLAAYPVFMHPRCMNCHPKGDQPLQGEDSHVHFQNVQRGPDGKGLFAMKCANCHQLKNLAGENMPPGHTEWHLPPANMRMVFEGKTPTELARQLKDPKQNGGKTPDQIVRHVAEDSLVATAWNPGACRTKPPMTQQEAGRKLLEWVGNGAAIP